MSFDYRGVSVKNLERYRGHYFSSLIALKAELQIVSIGKTTFHQGFSGRDKEIEHRGLLGQ